MGLPASASAPLPAHEAVNRPPPSITPSSAPILPPPLVMPPRLRTIVIPLEAPSQRLCDPPPPPLHPNPHPYPYGRTRTAEPSRACVVAPTWEGKDTHVCGTRGHAIPEGGGGVPWVRRLRRAGRQLGSGWVNVAGWAGEADRNHSVWWRCGHRRPKGQAMESPPPKGRGCGRGSGCDRSAFAARPAPPSNGQ